RASLPAEERNGRARCETRATSVGDRQRRVRAARGSDTTSRRSPRDRATFPAVLSERRRKGRGGVYSETRRWGILVRSRSEEEEAATAMGPMSPSRRCRLRTCLALSLVLVVVE